MTKWILKKSKKSWVTDILTSEILLQYVLYSKKYDFGELNVPVDCTVQLSSAAFEVGENRGRVGRVLFVMSNLQRVRR